MHHQHPWICQNIFENTWINCSDYIRALNMPDHLYVRQAFEDALQSKYARGLNMARVTQRSEYVWIWLNMPLCISICLDMAKYCPMSLNTCERAWINCPDYVRILNMSHHIRYSHDFEYASGIKYTRVLNMLQYTYNNIIVVTNIGYIRIFVCSICTSWPSANNHLILF